MPLIECEDCQESISSLAPACPHCGRPSGGTRAESKSDAKVPEGVWDLMNVDIGCGGIVLALGALISLAMAWNNRGVATATAVFATIIGFACLCLLYLRITQVTKRTVDRTSKRRRR